MKLTPTKEQQEILKAFKESRILKVNACAGSGKTSTLTMLAEDNPVPSLYLAFNKAIATEAQEKFPSHVTCRTTHSIAYAKFGSKLQQKLNSKMDFKVNTLHTLREIVQYFGIDDFDAKPNKIPARSLAFLAKEAVGNFETSADDTIGVNHIPYYEFNNLKKNFDFNQKQLALEVVKLACALWKERINPLSKARAYHDTYLKLWSMSNPVLGYDILYIDEAQDTNPAVLKVLEQQQCKICYVGDTYQSIYGFRGAVNAMETIVAPTKSLTQSWRYGEAVANVATFCVLGEMQIKGNPKIESKIIEDFLTTDKITCIFRTNSALLSTAYDLLTKGYKISVEIDVKNFISKLQSCVELSKGNTKGVKHQEIQKFASWADLIEYTKEDPETKRLANLALSPDVDSFIQHLSTVHEEKNPQIILTTAHKSKGREWDNVVVYSDFQFGKDPENILKGVSQQERNLLYVACTRAKSNLQLPDQMLWMEF